MAEIQACMQSCSRSLSQQCTLALMLAGIILDSSRTTIQLTGNTCVVYMGHFSCRRLHIVRYTSDCSSPPLKPPSVGEAFKSDVHGL